jgi:hypothetical protein
MLEVQNLVNELLTWDGILPCVEGVQRDLPSARHDVFTAMTTMSARAVTCLVSCTESPFLQMLMEKNISLYPLRFP